MASRPHLLAPKQKSHTYWRVYRTVWGCQCPGAPFTFWFGRGWNPRLCCGTSLSFPPTRGRIYTHQHRVFPFQLILCSFVFNSDLFDYGFWSKIAPCTLNWQPVCRLKSWRSKQNGRPRPEVIWTSSFYISITEFMAKSYSLKNSHHLDIIKTSSWYVFACYSLCFHPTLTCSPWLLQAIIGEFRHTPPSSDWASQVASDARWTPTDCQTGPTSSDFLPTSDRHLKFLFCQCSYS